MAKQKAQAPKEEAPKTAPKAKKKLILRKAIHIAGVVGDHRLGGAHYKAGDEVTDAMVKAYEANRKMIGGETPIDNFCE